MTTVKDIHVGKPPAEYHLEEDRVQIHFHDFEILTSTKGASVDSPNFVCAGHEWYLSLYPGGGSSSKDGMVSVFLGSHSQIEIEVDFDIVCKTKSGDSFQKYRGSGIKYAKVHSWGWLDFLERDKILDASNNVLINGTLVFEVRVRPTSDYYCRDVKPRPTLGEKFFLNEESSDVAFKVKGRVFHAHQIVLKAQAPDLAELTESYDKESPLPIKDVDPKIFEIMLRFVYGQDICPAEWHEHSKDILDAAGKYGFADLKSDAEAWYVKMAKKTFTVENAVDELLYADGKDCPLLKHAAVDFIVEHGEEVIESESYEKLDESPELRKEVMKAAFSSIKRNRNA